MDDVPPPINQHNPNFIDQLRAHIRSNQLAFATEKTYIHWSLRFIRYHDRKHPKHMGSHEVSQFLTHLAVERNSSPSTQRTALNALVYLYRRFLNQELVLDFKFATSSPRLPVVFTHREAMAVISALTGTNRLAAEIMYGSGLRISEVMRLRIKDLEFSQQQIIVRSGKGNKDRATILPEQLVHALKTQSSQAQLTHVQDLREGFGEVYMPYALARKYPHYAMSLVWQYLFPAATRSTDPRSFKVMRHHVQ